MKKWKLLKVIADGDPLEIEGTDIWSSSWKRLNEEPLIVPHPNYPDQRHKLIPRYIECNGKKIEFASGELSNCVWCFYVPEKNT